MRGDGSLYLRGRLWWFTYWHQGAKHHESLGTADEETAQKKARKIRDGLIAGTLPPSIERRVTVDELLDDLVTHLTVKKRASLGKTKSHLKPLREAFGRLRASTLRTSMVEQYQQDRQGDGRADATVNRECELLRQAYRLAVRRSPPKLTRLPLIPLLPVENARQGFIAGGDFIRILKAVENEDLRDFIEWFWWTGMRPNEIRQLTWEMLDNETWTLNLEPRVTKTRRPRLIPLEGPLREIMQRRLQARRLDSSLIFHRTAKGKAGQPIKDYRSTWRNACKAAGLKAGRKVAGGLTPYDLRRSALRNIVRGGTDYTVAMKISGHRTRSTFDRYNITSDEDVRAAIKRTADYVRSLPQTPRKPR